MPDVGLLPTLLIQLARIRVIVGQVIDTRTRLDQRLLAEHHVHPWDGDEARQVMPIRMQPWEPSNQNSPSVTYYPPPFDKDFLVLVDMLQDVETQDHVYR